MKGDRGMKTENLPKWNLADLYDGVESREYTALKQELIELTDRFAEEARNGSLRNTYPAGWLQGCLELYNRLGDSYEELDAFVSMWYTTSTTDQAALAELNSLEELGLGVQAAEVSFKNSVAEIADRLPEIFKAKPALAEYRFFLEEQLFFQQHQMSEKEESLAADLLRSGGNAWGRLFQAVSSTAAAEWEENASNEPGGKGSGLEELVSNEPGGKGSGLEELVSNEPGGKGSAAKKTTGEKKTSEKKTITEL